MTVLLSIVLFLVPGWASPQGGTGVVSGAARDVTGKPQVGVRVAAQVVPADGEARSGDVLVSIGKTDESGRYVLEVPPGRYHIIAGRVDRPTYYPESGNPNEARVFSITSGSRTDGIDFKVFALTGVVRDAAGKPQVGVRVAAIDANANSAIGCREFVANETATDNTGLYRLEILPGVYSIVVRLADRTTFYPHAQNKENATSIPIRDGITTSGLDIVVPVEAAAPGPVARDRELYLLGLENTRIGCHSAGRLQLQTLIGTFPDSPYASDAKYEMAESYYREGSPAALTDARKAFEEYIRFFPNAPRLPEARQRLLDIQQK